MRILLCLLALSLYITVEARQYIQCSQIDSFESVVVNLNGEQSTLFLTQGVHLPDGVNVLKSIKKLEENDEFDIYHSIDQDSAILERIFIPVEIIDTASNYFNIVIEFINLETDFSMDVEYSCFSSIYDE